MNDHTTPQTQPPACRLYLVSPPQIELSDFARQLREALRGGDVGAFQLRLKEADDDTIRRAVRQLQPICRDGEVAFILNDRPELAFELGCDGVHLGQDDMKLTEARKQAGPDAVIGISCHDSAHLAMEAGEGGADYVAFGAFYPTTSKAPDKLARYGVPKPDIIEWWYTYTVLPCVAIGGITPQNCLPLVKAGADFIAAITAVWNHPKGASRAVEKFNQSIRRGLEEREIAANETENAAVPA